MSTCLVWNDLEVMEMKENISWIMATSTINWQHLPWNQGNIYPELAKYPVKWGQYLPWTGKLLCEMRAISTLNWQNRPWNQGNIYPERKNRPWNKGDIYHELAKSSVKSGQPLSLTLAQRRYYIPFLTWKEGVFLWSLHLF